MHHRILVFQIPVTILPATDDPRSIENVLVQIQSCGLFFKETVIVSISFNILALTTLVFRITF